MLTLDDMCADAKAKADALGHCIGIWLPQVDSGACNVAQSACCWCGDTIRVLFLERSISGPATWRACYSDEAKREGT